MLKRPMIFICMPITPRSPDKNHAIEFLGHIRHGAQVAIELIKMGACVYCPGNDLLWWLVGEGPTPEQIYEQDLDIIKHCDALVTLPGWEESTNCRKEVRTAYEACLHVFQYPDEIQELAFLIRHFEDITNV